MLKYLIDTIDKLISVILTITLSQLLCMSMKTTITVILSYTVKSPAFWTLYLDITTMNILEKKNRGSNDVN